MTFLFIVGLIVVVPFVELWLIIQVGREVGFIPTLAVLFAVSILGSAVVKREGVKVYRDFTGAISRGEIPSREIVHGVCILIAGVFLLAPGFVTDILAILLLLPPVRGVVAAVVLRRSAKRVTVRRARWSGPGVTPGGTIGSGSGEIIDVEYRDEGRHDA